MELVLALRAFPSQTSHISLQRACQARLYLLRGSIGVVFHPRKGSQGLREPPFGYQSPRKGDREAPAPSALLVANDPRCIVELR